jgi:hypothetical protein
MSPWDDWPTDTQSDDDEQEADEQARALLQEFGVEELEEMAVTAATAGVGASLVLRAITLLHADRLELALRHTDVLQMLPHRWADHGVPAAELC